jgi:PAS domain-containing protein
MRQRSLELILARTLAGHLAVPAFIVDATSTIVWFNESAERLLGLPFEATAELSIEEFISVLDLRDMDGAPMKPEGLPFAAAVTQAQPGIVVARLGAMSDALEIMIATLPLVGRDGEVVGALGAAYTNGRAR